MQTSTINREDLLRAWPVASLVELRKMIAGLGGRLLSDIQTRQDLVASITHSPSMVDREERILLAMGNLSYVDQDGQKCWWGFVKHNEDSISLAVKAKLHTRYMLPEDTKKLFSEWIDDGRWFHRSSILVWDEAVSISTQPFIMGAILNPIDFSQEHMYFWKDRMIACWQSAPTEIKRDIIRNFIVDGADSAVLTLQDGYDERLDFIMQWSKLLLDDCETTLQAVPWGLSLARRPNVRINEDLAGFFQSHVDAHQIESATQKITASSSPRSRL